MSALEAVYPSATSIDGHHVSWTVPFAPSSARTARTDVTVELRRHGATQRTIDDARIVVSELVGNALRYAEPLPSGGLEVALDIDSESVRVAVSDGGSVTLPTLLNPPPMAPKGRGLTIVGTLAHSWGVHEGTHGNTVYGVLRRHLS